MLKIVNFISRWMAVIILLAAVLAMAFPQVGGLISTSWINWMLGIVMLGMGLMLRWEDFRIVFSRPRDVLLGNVLQFVIMPSLGYLLTVIFRLPPDLAVGVILVGCCPGGTASNVITYLAGGDLALSVGITSVSTLLAPIVTPLLVWLLAGTMVNVDVVTMFLSIVQVVILPIAIGIIIRHYATSFADKVAVYLPAVSVIAIALIVCAVVAANQVALLTSGITILIVVILHNLLGFAFGYGAASLCRMSRPKRIALSVEVGMQNSGLACSLAHQHFAAMAMAGVPGAIFSVWHNLSGALVWGRKGHTA
jgi:BASS family bile acid:Na+ symporter